MRPFIAAAFAATFLLPALPAAGEAYIFRLRSGGRVEGELLNAEENPRTSYVIALSGGGQVTLDAATVDRLQPQRPEVLEYEKIRRQYPDTVEGQLKLAAWCRDHDLTEQRKAHLERVLRLDPDQADARRLLGYRKFKEQWMTHDQEMADKGLVERDGKWMTKEDAALHDSREKQHKAESEWRQKISRWQNWLNGRRAEEAAKNLRAIDDPMAIVGLADWLKKDVRRQDARLIDVEALGRISASKADDAKMARGPLAAAAIDDPVEEVRLSCLDELAKQPDDGVTSYFVGRMRDKHASIAVINRAGVALGRIKDPSCIETLIQYLVTYHDDVIQPPGGPGAMTTTFGTKGTPGIGLGMNQKPTIVRRQAHNSGVLEALVAITGQNFGYDQPAWNSWYTSQKAKGLPVVKQS